MITPNRILLADNDPDFLDTRRRFVEREGFEVVSATNPADAVQILEQGIVDVAVLDIRLLNDSDTGDISGLEIAKATNSPVPIIMLTGYESLDLVRESLRPRVDGTQPAEDFVSKQEGPEALLTAIRKALLRKRQSSLQVLGSADFQLDIANRHLRVENAVINLTTQEFSFLEYLFRRPNQVVSREEIVLNALGEKDEYDSYSDAGRLDTMLGRLRKKFEPDPSQPRYLITVRGHGFKVVV